jgi:glycosyltransferase involved in cell wall biosynthesis
MKEYAGKLLIIVQNLPVPFDRRVWLEAKTLRDHGLKVSVICPKAKGFNKSYEVIDDISVYRYKMPVEADGVLGYLFEFAYAWLATAFLSVKVHMREGFDVIQACNPPDTYWLLGFIYRFLGKKYVFDHHDLSPEMFDAKYDGKKKILRKMLLWLEKMALKSAKLVLSTNESYKKIAIQRGGKNPKDVYVVRTGPDLNRLQQRTPESELRRGKKNMVCYLGEMCPQDGVDVLLESIDYFINDLGRRDTQFMLVGGGPAMPEMKRLSEEMNLSEFVEFTGRVSDDDLCRYLSSADVCVDPDPWSEWSNHSTMNKVLEYMTFAKPIVAFDLEENKNSAKQAALYVKPNDIKLFARAIDELLDDPDRCEEMGEFGYARIRGQLSWKHTQKGLIAAYYRLFPKMMTDDEAEQNIMDLMMAKISSDSVDLDMKTSDEKDPNLFVLDVDGQEDIVQIAQRILNDSI